jgi:hypothetical protein
VFLSFHGGIQWAANSEMLWTSLGTTTLKIF